MAKARRKIAAALKTRDALEGATRAGAVNELAQRHQVHPNQIYAWKKQLLGHAPPAFDVKFGAYVDRRSRKVEKLHPKIGQLAVENDFFTKTLGR